MRNSRQKVMSDWTPTDDEILVALAEANVIWRNCNLCFGELRAFYGMLRAAERAAAAQSMLANTTIRGGTSAA